MRSAIAGWCTLVWLSLPLVGEARADEGRGAPAAPLSAAFEKAPQTKYSVPGPTEVTITPKRIVADNVRAAAVLYAAHQLEEMKLFSTADKIVDAFVQGQLPIEGSAGDSLRRYHARRSDRLDPVSRVEIPQFVAGLIESTFQNVVSSSVQQMEGYAGLLASVADSIDDFARDDVSPKRDALAEDLRKASAAFGLTLSNRCYGGAHFAAAALEQHRADAMAVVSNPAVLKAHRVSTYAELIAKLTGAPVGEIQRLEERAAAGSQLIGALAAHAALLDDATKARDLARRLGKLGRVARRWLAVKPGPVPQGAAPKPVRVLCYDDKRRLVPCVVRSAD